MPILVKGEILGGSEKCVGTASRSTHRQVICRVDDITTCPVPGRGPEILFEAGHRNRIRPCSRKTMENCSPHPPSLAWRTIWAVSRLWGRPRTGERATALYRTSEVESVDRGDAGLYEFAGIGPCGGVDGGTVDVAPDTGDDGWPTIAGIADTVEYPASSSGDRLISSGWSKADPNCSQIKIVGAGGPRIKVLFPGTADSQTVTLAAAVIPDEPGRRKQCQAFSTTNRPPRAEQAVRYLWRSFAVLAKLSMLYPDILQTPE